MATGAGGEPAHLPVAPAAARPSVVSVLYVHRVKLGELQVAERRSEVVVDDLGVPLS